MAQELCGGGGCLGDVHDRDIQQLLQALAAVFAVAGLDDRVEGFGVVDDLVHHGDRREVALEVSFAGISTEVGRQLDDFGARGSGRAGRIAD